jgi:hypothetical protein
MLEPGNVPGSFETIVKASVQHPCQIAIPRRVNGNLDELPCPHLNVRGF